MFINYPLRIFTNHQGNEKKGVNKGFILNINKPFGNENPAFGKR